MDAFNEIESTIYMLCSVSVSCPCDIVHCTVTLRVSQPPCPRVPCACTLRIVYVLCFDFQTSTETRGLIKCLGLPKPKQQTVFCKLSCLT